MARKRKRRAPGEGGIYERKERGTWTASVVTSYDPETGNPQRRVKNHSTMAEARAWLIQQQAALASGRTLGENATLLEVYEEWLANGKAVGGRDQRGWKSATVSTYESTLGRYVLPALGRKRARDITPANVQRLLADLARGGASPATRRRVRSYLSLVLGQAARLGTIPSNPVSRVPAPPRPDTPIQRWSEDEIGKIVRTCLEVDDQTARYVLVALGTGFRTEELLGMTWSSVDLNDRTITMSRVATEVEGRIEVREDDGKSPAALRVVPVDLITVGALIRQREHVLRLRELRAEFDERRAVAGQSRLGWADPEVVFPTSVGTVVGRSALRARFNELQAAAGVTHIKLYATRSTHGSFLADAGVNLHALAERLGHTDPRFTAKVYLRGSSSAHRAVADKVGEILGCSLGADGASGGDPEQPDNGVGEGN